VKALVERRQRWALLLLKVNFTGLLWAHMGT